MLLTVTDARYCTMRRVVINLRRSTSCWMSATLILIKCKIWDSLPFIWLLGELLQLATSLNNIALGMRRRICIKLSRVQILHPSPAGLIIGCLEFNSTRICKCSLTIGRSKHFSFVSMLLLSDYLS